MADKDDVRILHQDLLSETGEISDYLVVMEIDKLDVIYMCYKSYFPKDFQETKKTFRLYPFVHN